MGILDIILIGIALSMDASALTIANCTTYGTTLNRKKEWAMPITFAIFQGIMPLIGYFVGSTFADQIADFSGYLTAIIFFILGDKILYDIIKEKIEQKKEIQKEEVKKPFNFLLLIIQGIATSIDALFIGVTFSLELAFSVYIAVVIVACVTFVVVAIALLFGKYLGKLFGKYAEYVGIVILYALTIKTLIETIVS